MSSYLGLWGHSPVAVSGDLIIDSLTIDAGQTVNIILDEDDMVSDRDDALATQQSIKAYIDAQIAATPVAKSYTFTSRWSGHVLCGWLL
jgi:hypothetical protein